VTTHGDFHRNNLLVGDGPLWVIDWELSGRGPAGSDLLHLWCSLDDEEDRERLYRGIVELIGRRHEHALLKLRYSAMVATIAGLLTAPHLFDRDRSRAERLLADLPVLRAEARTAI
jgi:aminoglycoside phosphotransferase (APT) family kinase protein